MKKINLLLAAILVAAGMSSCSQDENGISGGSGNNEAGGEVRMTLGFAKSGETKSAQSTAKPTTSWSGNIKDLMILFVAPDPADNIEKVVDSRKIDVEHLAPSGKEITTTLTNIIVKPNYTVYVIANSQQADVKAAVGTDGPAWNENISVGKPISGLLMQLVAYGAGVTGTDPAGSNIYKQPAEIFVGIAQHVDVANAGVTPVAVELSRAISMMRVRIDPGTGANKDVDFTGATASFRIRRATTAINPVGTITKGATTDVLYTKAPFHTGEPASGYSQGQMLTDNFKYWQDIRMFPGGSKNAGADKFDFVLIGHAPEGYLPLGKDQGLGAGGADVAWTAAVSTAIDKNSILEINLILTRAGVLIDPDNPVIPEVGEYANVTVHVTLMDWGAIVSEDIPV